MIVPRLGDLSPTKMKFKAGDRVIARVNQTLNYEQWKKITSSLDQYAGVQLDSLIVNCSVIELIQQGVGVPPVCIAGRAHYSSSDAHVFKFGCSVVNISEGDVFFLSMRYIEFNSRRREEKRIQNWIGDNELRVIPWTSF